MKKLLIFAIVVIGFSASSFAQLTANATVTGKVIGAITVVNAGNMNFGSVISNGPGGTVVLTPSGGVTRTGILNGGDATAAAHFTVTGTAGAAYSFITSPATIAVTNGTPANDMTISAFSDDNTATITGGTVTVNVGATLTVGANQPAGTYNSYALTPLTVTVAYN